MTIQIDLNNNGSFTDITEYVDATSLQLQDRCDEAFASGVCKAWFKGDQWKYNIAPYTIMKINNSYYVCKSTCTKYIAEDDVYVHDFDIMEATALLSCFIVGTKVFSNRGTNTRDIDKINILYALMKQKYNITFSTTAVPQDLANGSKDYAFSNKSTLFDCLSEIAGQYNTRVFVNSITSSAISIQFLGANDTIYSPSNVMSVQYSQDTDTYGKRIECEAQNVVDRTTLTHIDNLTVRADDALLNNDTANITLPSKIESIEDIGINLSDNDDVLICTYIPKTVTFSGDAIGDGNSELYSTLAESIIYTKSDGTKVYLFEELWNDEFSKHYPDKTSFYEQTWHIMFYDDYYYIYMTQTRTVDTTGIENNFTGRFTLHGLVLEKAQWDLLTAKDQTSYAVYTSGENMISNLNATYKNDIWNIILDNTRYNFISNTSNSSNVNYFYDDVTFQYRFNAMSGNKYAYDYVWYVDYYAIADPVLEDTKDSPLNETSFKDYSRSYNNNASLIDFDKVIKNMHISNDTLGRPELSLELDVTDEEEPKARQKIKYNNVDWYISSVIKQYKNNATICTVNCVYNYNKKAEAIQADTEYVSTKFSGKYIERPIFTTDTMSYYDDEQPVYLKLWFYPTSETTTPLKYLVPLIRMENDGTYYFNAKMLDHVSVGWYASYQSSGSVEQYYAGYVSSFNECYKVNYQLIQLASALTRDESFALPTYDKSVSSNFIYLTDGKEVILYKDAKEQLSFTIKATETSE